MYAISKTLMKRILDVLDDHQFSDGGEYNNDKVIDLMDTLNDLIEEQNNLDK